jgi:hypothetical protein
MSRRLLARCAAAFAATSFASVAVAFGSMGSAATGGGAGMVRAAGMFALLVACPAGMAAVLGWWSVTGWQRAPASPAVAAVLGGAAGVYVWVVGGLVVSAVWQQAQGGTVANTVGLYPVLSAPLGLLVGAAWGYRRAQGAQSAVD